MLIKNDLIEIESRLVVIRGWGSWWGDTLVKVFKITVRRNKLKIFFTT
jgi:hypothetical protein